MKMKRMIALLLAVVCVLGLLALPAFADEPVDPPDPEESILPETSPDPNPEESTLPETSPDVTEPPESSPEPTPDPEPTPEPTPTGPWYQAAMDYAKENGLLKGDQNGEMNPGRSATRAEIATILRRVFGNTQGKDISHFTDVPKNLWYYSEMSVMAEMGILKGDAAFTMRPNDPISRQEAFSLIARAFRVPDGDPAKLNSFLDAGSVAGWAKSTLAGMVDAGLVQGSENRLNPTGNITRAEFAQVLYNMNIQFCKDPANLPKDGIVVYTGPSPLDVTGFAGRLFLGGGTAMTLTGDAPEAEIIVRLEPNARVTVNGAVKSVDLCSNGAVLDGSGSAGTVGKYAADCRVELQSGQQTQSYDDGLRGVRAVATNPVPALTPDNRTVDVYITYSGMRENGAVNGVRSCTLRWWLDGVRQPDRAVSLRNPDVTPGFTVSGPSLWRRDTPNSEHKIHVQLLYGTDCITTDIVVPVRNYTDAEYAAIVRNNSYPYRIDVVKNKCTVLIYGLDKSGNYSILHRCFICSPGDATPTGNFPLKVVGSDSGERRDSRGVPWAPLMGGVWGQYCRRITGGVFFHSVYYSTFGDPSTLYYSAYNQLGTICSHGCVRVRVCDAKWMYENAPLGTTVRIYNSSTLPVPKPTAQKLSGRFGWDPTDPDPRNPWNK